MTSASGSPRPHSLCSLRAPPGTPGFLLRADRRTVYCCGHDDEARRSRRAAHAGPLARVPASLLVVGGVVGLEGGASIAITLIPAAGVAGTVALRLGSGAAGLCVIIRPRLRDLSARSILLVPVVGAILLAHHLLFYAAIGRLPLGVAVTLEFAGPGISARRSMCHRTGGWSGTPLRPAAGR
jgi:hypothetical protein